MKAFTIRDLKAETFSVPFFAQTAGLAMRTLQQQVPQDDPMRAYSADFALFETGSWDAQTGNLSALVSPIFIIELMNLFEKSQTPTVETTPNGS